MSLTEEDSLPVPDAINKLQFLCKNIWQRDKDLFADQVAGLLPAILKTMLEQSREMNKLRVERDALRGSLLTAQNSIARMNIEQVEAKRMIDVYRDWNESLNRISAVMETTDREGE